MIGGLLAPRDAALGLGSNLGDKAANIARAVALIAARGVMGPLTVSALYRSPPWGGVAQDWFVNACIAGDALVSPEDLLRACLDIEAQMGRVRAERWGPRLIDIDVLYVGDGARATPALTLPHPHMTTRAFVLRPLAQIRPELEIDGRGIAAMAAQFGTHEAEAF